MYLLAPFQNIKQFVQIFTANNRYKAKKKGKKRKKKGNNTTHTTDISVGVAITSCSLWTHTSYFSLNTAIY